MNTLTDIIRRYRDLLEEALEMYWLFLGEDSFDSTLETDTIALKIMEELHPEKVSRAREVASKFGQGWGSPGDLLLYILAFEHPEEVDKL